MPTRKELCSELKILCLIPMITACGIINGTFTRSIEPSSVPLLQKGKNVIWMDLADPSKQELSFLESKLGLHHLALEDALNQRQRAKVERYDEYHFIVVHSITETEKLEATQLNLFISKHALISIHIKPLQFVSDVKRRLGENPHLLRRGPDYGAYMLLDASADNLFPLMDKLEETIDKIEEEVFKERGSSPKGLLNSLFRVKKGLLHLRKITWPQMEVLNVLSSGELKYISKENLVYFRDVYDHMIRINTIIETQRELVSGSMEGHLMSVSNNLNKIMKKLTAITAIVLVPGLIAGIYGMNFKAPELNWEFGFYASLASMLLSTILLAVYFKQKDWI
ncbi:MAG TPA: magnesium/cobalt transporter CorA [Candidatus Norongarragalinales archaeon]|nr:magnesium/cobalt transporter CorA [Candidatus Norongarragalinales archaeon]